MKTTLVPLLASLLLAVSCAHTPAEPAFVEPKSVCEPVTSVAATRTGRPALGSGGSCDENKRACQEKADPATCYLAGGCTQSDWMVARGNEAGPALLDATLANLKVACEGGITEACLARAGVRQEAGTAEKDTCDDIVRACHLGDEAGGCIACFKSGCAG